MRKGLIAGLLILLLLWPSCAAAAAFKMDISIVRLDDGTIRGELWYDNRLLWRVELVADGATPVTGGPPGTTTSVVPDIVDGMLLLKVNTN